MSGFPLRAALAVSGLVCLFSTSIASAQALNDKYWLEGQAFFPNVSTTVSVSAKNETVGTTINLEKDLDLDDHQTLPAVYGGVRFGRFSLIGEYYALNRSGVASISKDITFNDVVYPAGATVSSSLDTDVYRAAFGYSFVRKNNLELGAALGLHLTNFKIELSGDGHIGSAALQSEARKEDALAPLPTLGLFGTYEIAPRVQLGARVDYLSLKIGDYDGRLINTQANASYQVFRNVGLGVMYRYVDYRLKVDKDAWLGELSYRFNGPALFVRASF